MIADLAKALLEFLKLAPRYFIAAGGVCGVLLYADAQFLQEIGVAEFAKDNRSVLGLTLLGSVALLSIAIWSAVSDTFGGWWRKRKRDIRMQERLQNLTEDEKQILRFYIAQQTRGNILRIDDGAVQGLVSSGIIYRSASLGNMLEGFAHNISDFAWNYLHVYPHLLDGSTNTYRTDRRPNYW